MKIEVGKRYELDSGLEATIVVEIPPNPYTASPRAYPFRGYIKGRESLYCWNGQGHGEVSTPNILKEWVEPPTPLQVCQHIDRLASEPDAKISWPHMTDLVTMARAAIAAAK